MVTISRFQGIRIEIRYREHGPPHFHALYGQFDVSVYWRSGIIEGRFPRRPIALVIQWYEAHITELEENWGLAAAHQALRQIPPLG
jgi:Domain of unknown function (DUF4160)